MEITMSAKRISTEKMTNKYPNEWLFIIEPKTQQHTTQLVSGIVKIQNKSRDDVYEASKKFKRDAAIRYKVNSSSQEHRPKMPLYKPKTIN